MNNQIKDWENLKGLCKEVAKGRGLAKQETLQEFYDGVMKYYHKYKDKFNPEVRPE